MFARDLKQGSLRRLGLGINQIHDRALILANYSGVRFGNKVANRRRVPVIPPGHSAVIVQSLLHDGPLAIRSHNETVKVNLKPVSDSVVVDARGKSTGAHQGFAIQPTPLGDRSQFMRRVPRKPAATTADEDSEFTRARRESALERAHY